MVFRRIATGIIASLAVVSESTMGIRMDRKPDLFLISDERTEMTFLLKKNEEQETGFPLMYMRPQMNYVWFPCKYVIAASSIELKDEGNNVLYTISGAEELTPFKEFLQRQNLKANEESDPYPAGAFDIYSPPEEGSSEEAEEQKYQDDLIKAKADSLKEQQEVEINHCVICMAEEQLKEGDTIQLECGHGNEFHAKCLYTSVQHGPKPQCPLCRKEFPSETLDELEVAETQRILTLSQNQQ